jgi:hypothetical protein
MSLAKQQTLPKQKQQPNWTFLFCLWIALVVPLLALGASYTPLTTPTAVDSNLPATNVQTARVTNAQTAQLVAYSNVLSVPESDVSILERDALVNRDRATRVQATVELNRMRTNWANIIGVEMLAWDAVTTTPGSAPKIAIAVRRDLYISVDGGQTFEQKQNVLPSMVNSLAIHPTDKNLYYAGVDGLGFFISRDNGDTWHTSNAGITVPAGARFGITAIEIDARAPQTIYIASAVWIGTSQVTFHPLGILKSVDGGETWTLLESESPQAIDYMLLDGNTLHTWHNGFYSAFLVS